jgi:ABC-type transport system substrate-binding protein
MGFARAAGINMTTVPVSFGTDWRPKVADAKGDFEGISFKPDAAANLPDPVEFMTALFHPSGGVNYTGFNSQDSQFQKGDTKLNDLLTKARIDFDDKARKEALLQLQKIVADEQYIVRFPGAANSFVMSWPAVRNVEVYTGDLMGINEWIDPTKAPIAKS